PEGGLSFGRRRRCSLLTDPLRDMLWCPCGRTSRLASAQNPLPRMYSYFGDTTLARLKIQEQPPRPTTKFSPTAPTAGLTGAASHFQHEPWNIPVLWLQSASSSWAVGSSVWPQPSSWAGDCPASPSRVWRQRRP